MRQARVPAILVVDASPILRSVIRIYLAREPYEVLEASSMAAALERLTQRRVALVLADLEDAGSGALDLLACVRSHARATVRTVPLVFFVAPRAGAARRRAREVGECDFLEKPVRDVPLLTIVRRHIPGPAAAAAGPDRPRRRS